MTMTATFEPTKYFADIYEFEVFIQENLDEESGEDANDISLSILGYEGFSITRRLTKPREKYVEMHGKDWLYEFYRVNEITKDVVFVFTD